MSNVASLAATAALIGEPARTAMLLSLMDGRALTAGELGQAAGVTPPTASGHLGRMLEAGLLALERQGRHRYYRLAGPAVAATIENLIALSCTLDAVHAKAIVTGPRDKAMRHLRLCYDHLAGEVAVAMTDSMIACGHLDLAQDGAALTASGVAFLASLGVEPIDADAHRPRTTFCRLCLDWSERRPHIAGVVGRQLYGALVRDGWVSPPGAGRTIAITPRGAAQLEHYFGLA